MKQIGSQFLSDEEYQQLILAKGDMSWKEFMLAAAKIFLAQKEQKNEVDKNGDN